MESLTKSTQVFKSPGINITIFSYFGNYLEFYYFITQINKKIREGFYKWEEEYKNMLNKNRVEVTFSKFDERKAQRILQLSKNLVFFKFKILTETTQGLTEVFNLIDIWDNVEDLRISSLTSRKSFSLDNKDDLEIYSRFLDIVNKYPNIIERSGLINVSIFDYYLKEDEGRMVNMIKLFTINPDEYPKLLDKELELTRAEINL